MKKFTCEIYAEKPEHIINELRNLAEEIEQGHNHGDNTLPVMNFESNWMMIDIKKKGKKRKEDFGW
jgi:hypothetical protein